MPLKIISYNCRGFNISKVPFIVELLDECDILCLQETWLFSNQFNKFDEYFKNMQSINVCGMNECVPIHGRPYGGVSIIYKYSNANIERIMFDSKRVCAAKISIDNVCIVLFNVYMPCDGGNNFDVEEYNRILGDISLYCRNNNVYHFILLGDMNTDLSRSRSMNTISLNAFVDDELLYYCEKT